uniref:Uncharacterized protein n=1 Tax=Rhizophora mucronata TaxID=61149 RepID=A0A2P2LY18_RHIMU
MLHNQIDCEVKEQDANECQHHDASSLTVDRSEHQVIGPSAEVEYEKNHSFSGVEDGKVDFQETVGIEEDDYSDSVPMSEDDNKIVREHQLRSVDGQPGKARSDMGREQDLQAQVQHGPPVKISAITGVGLQELLQLIDERLEPHDQKLETQDITEMGIFGQKLRPPCAGDLGMEVEK